MIGGKGLKVKIFENLLPHFWPFCCWCVYCKQCSAAQNSWIAPLNETSVAYACVYVGACQGVNSWFVPVCFRIAQCLESYDQITKSVLWCLGSLKSFLRALQVPPNKILQNQKRFYSWVMAQLASHKSMCESQLSWCKYRLAP